MGLLLHFHKFFVNFSWETVIAVGLKVPIVFNNVKKSLWKHNQFTSASIKATLFYLHVFSGETEWLIQTLQWCFFFSFDILIHTFLHLNLLKANLKVVLCGALSCHYGTWIEFVLSQGKLLNAKSRFAFISVALCQFTLPTAPAWMRFVL